MSQKKKPDKDLQLVVLLRAAGGAYLLYLAWGLREADFSGRGIVYLLGMIVFALAGAALVIWSLLQLYRGDYLLPGAIVDPKKFEDSPDDDAKKDGP